MENHRKVKRAPAQLLVFFWLAGLAVGLLGACERAASLPTPLPAEYLPTAIALTIQAAQTPSATLASRTQSGASTPAPTLTNSSPEATPAPTRRLLEAVSSTPTRPRPTAAPSRTATPMLPASPTNTSRPPTRTRTPTATPQIPQAEIEFIRPGPGSKVTSPINLAVNLNPGPSRSVQIELLGEDSRILVRKVLSYASEERLRIDTEINFEISAVAEAARLRVITSDTAGRVVSLASVDLILLSIGDADLTPAGDNLAAIVIREPRPNILIQGGTLVVSGQARPQSDQPLLIELIDSDGRIVGYRQATVIATPGETHGTFMTEVPYTVTSTTWVRVLVSEPGGPFEGPRHVTSILVLIGP